MEVQSNKLQTLKSLNALLVKETFEGREQIDALLKSKQQLETTISRSKTEKRRFQDEASAAEIQRTINQVFVSEQLKSQLRNNEVDKLRQVVVDLEKVNVEAKDEIARTRMERDGVLREKVEFDGVYVDLRREIGVVSEKREIEEAKLVRHLVVSNLEKEVKSLHNKIRAFEGVVLKGDEEPSQIKLERDRLVDEKKERERTLEMVVKDKESIEVRLAESVKLVEELWNENIGISDMIKEERAKQVVTITERVIAETGGMTADLSKETNALKAIFLILVRKSEVGPNDPNGIKPEKINGYIELKDVDFAYPARPKQLIFTGLSLNIEVEKPWHSLNKVGRANQPSSGLWNGSMTY
ncbi:hypothetical protein GIB67_027767 [Kingdonia uniflora]|uniref:Uncharacterized protein n=1 Tax=Kingdonia uniflora TaxID=39325 RepID=A0A7J7PBZ9_9MAGN|nr:hypothetical protein GIB67_027767 [Kingdonia uniflora]